ncbi:MAG TPA: CheR family methyltransferase [Marinagarivorans sp.]
MRSAVRAITPKEFSLFQDLIKRKSGIFLPDHKISLLYNRLERRVLVRGCKDFSAYYHLITQRSETSELEAALEHITTNETFFFRETQHFDFVRQWLANRANEQGKLRVWSAAASSGEEAYSLAMTMDRYYQGPWEVFGSDINRQVIERAREAIYPDVRTEGIDQHNRMTYCLKGTGEYQGYIRIAPELRRRVSFDCINLTEPINLNLGLYDLIFLRNVMIYFEKHTQQRVVSYLSRFLKKDGFFFVSHSESLHSLNTGFELVKPAIYRFKS